MPRVDGLEVLRQIKSDPPSQVGRRSLHGGDAALRAEHPQGFDITPLFRLPYSVSPHHVSRV